MNATCYECGSPFTTCDCEDGFLECACVRIDVDLEDARNCPVHGPNSAMARRIREQEAADEAAWWQGVAHG